jgi:hypothetical protein
MIDPVATADAIRILEQKRIEAAPLPPSIWDFLNNAGKRLDEELNDYFRHQSEAPEQRERP